MRKYIFVPLFLVGFLLTTGLTPAFAQSNDVIVSATADITTAIVNDTINVSITAENSTDSVHGFEFTLTYDTSTVAFTSGASGGWLESTGRTLTCSSPITDGSTVTVACVTIDTACTGITAPSGDGTLYTMQFTAIADGVSPIDLGGVMLQGDASTAEIPINATNDTSVTVGSSIPSAVTTESIQHNSDFPLLFTLIGLLLVASLVALCTRRQTLFAIFFVLGMSAAFITSVPYWAEAQSDDDVTTVAGQYACSTDDACYDSANDADADGTISLTDMIAVANASCALPTATPTAPDSSSSVWVMNTTGETSDMLSGVEVNVTNVEIQTIDGVDYQCITSSGIPNYETTVDQAILDGLTSRPNFATDFANGVDISNGDIVLFGEDIGYELASGCTDVGDGYGYWPFGPACPSDQAKNWCFTLDPQPLPNDDNSCGTALNQIGAWVNGVSIFDWQDGQSYNNGGVWQNNAFSFEIYDLDVCVGHAANGNYHHHSHPTCLQAQLEDDGSGPSPIYGYAADGYPIYGPWESAGTLVNSCWKPRDYSAGSATGCADGTRSCLLVDQYDITQGTETAASAGPSTTDTVNSMSGNPILTESGVYFQDYYYDPACTAQGDTYLDEHNGHDTGDGYHYHVTMEEIAAGEYNFTFPYYHGPAYYGELPANAIASCSTGAGPGGGGPPGGGPPGGGPPP